MIEGTPTSNVVFVGSNDRPAWVAGLVAEAVRNTGSANVQAIGMSAVNQAVKGLIYATQKLDADRIKISIRPHFVPAVIGGITEKTAIRFDVGVIA